MKIVMLAHSTLAHLVGGIESHVDGVAAAAAELGHDVLVLTTAHPDGRPEEIDRGVRTRYLAGTRPAVRSRGWYRASLAAVRGLRARGLGDLLLSAGTAGAGVAGERLGIPHHAFSFGKTISHAVSEWYNSTPAARALVYPRRLVGLLRHAAEERRLWSRVDGVIATYDALYEELLRRRLPVVLSYNGTDTRVFRPGAADPAATRRALGIPAEATVLLMAATVNRQKGIWVGVEAFLRLAARSPDLHLVVAGDGPERAHLETAARGSRAHFLGAVPIRGMPACFAAADVLLYPTFRLEGLPNAIVQALASGVPVIASDRGGIRSAVRDGETGVLLRKPTVGALASAVDAVVADRDARLGMGRRGVELARERFDLRGIVERLLADLSAIGVPSRARH